MTKCLRTPVLKREHGGLWFNLRGTAENLWEPLVYSNNMKHMEEGMLYLSQVVLQAEADPQYELFCSTL